MKEVRGSSIFSDLQSRIADRLRDALPASITDAVLSENKKDLFNEIERRVNNGLLILVMTPAITQGETPGQLRVQVMVQITENTILNRSDAGTYYVAVDIGDISAAALTDPEWSIDPWTAFEFDGLNLVDEDSENTSITWQASFVTYVIVGLSEGPSNVREVSEPC